MIRTCFFALLTLIYTLSVPTIATAQDTKKGAGDTVRYASLRADEVNVRAGPGVRYPVKWVFVQRNLPVEITAEYETWRKVRDSTGAEGWVHRAMLFGRRNVLVIDKQATMRRQPQDDSPAIARLNPGMVARLEICGTIWCNVSVQGYEGWLRRAEVWGLYLDEQPK